MNRSLGWMLLQFVVVVILPNNEVGTAGLPAVTARQVIGAQGVRVAAPSRDKPHHPVALARDLNRRIVDSPARAVCCGFPSRAAALKLSQRLRI